MWSTVETMRVLMGVLVALLGAVVGAAGGVAIIYALSGVEGADALTLVASGVFFCVPLTLGGAVATGLLWRRLFPAVFPSSRQGVTGFAASVVYGIAASMLVLVVGPVVVISSWGTSGRDLLAGKLCEKPGTRYISAPGQKVHVCFTLTPDRSTWVEIGWRFGSASGCPGGSRGATSYDWGDKLASPGQITEPDFTATIRGARASGVLKDSAVCAGKKFKWSARLAP